MSIRLNKVIRDLNVGITTAVEFLHKKGFTIEENPSTKITDEQYNLLVKEFSTDKDLKMKSERFNQERHGRNKGVVAIDGYEEKKEKEKPKPEEIKTVVPEEIRPKIKPVDKIDLDAKHTPKPVQEKSTPQAEETTTVKKEAEKPAEPLAESPQEVVVEPQPLAPAAAKEEKREESADNSRTKQTPSEEKPSESPTKETLAPVVDAAEAPTSPIQEKEDAQPVAPQPSAEAPATPAKPQEAEVFTLHDKSEFTSKLNIIGQIDLAKLNQSTRPKKKSRSEKRREREEKDRIRQDQKKALKEAIIKEIRRDEPKKDEKPKEGEEGKKRRHRINKAKVDITNAANFQPAEKKKDDKPKQGGDNKGRGKGDRNKDRFKKPVVKQEPSEEDVAKQVKETLARLTTKGKSKTSKYRKEKRDIVAGRKEELESMELADSKVLKLTEFVTANELANMMNISVTQVIATCMSVGIMVSINQRLDAETINLVAEEFGFKTEYVSAEVAQAIVEEADAEEDLVPRAPIVTVMGHVDHGKTSLLDYIRKANVIAGEAGGITQHIGAYHVTLEDGRKITFLDTPGHEAFTAMRARGAKVTDVAIIIVAADDNVMPQTKEAINHAMAAGVPIVFAINKIDKAGANPDKIKEELSAMNFLVEEWGGKYQSQDISAKKGVGVNELLEKVLLEAEMLELKANPNRKAIGSIIESSLDKGRGYVATVLVSNGTLHVGDIVLAGAAYGKVKAMFNERNQRIKEAGPSEPVLILGLNGAPAAGDSFHVFDSEQEAREIANKREQLQREQGLRTQKMLTLDEVGRRLALGDFHELNVIVKGDVDGSVEALSDSLIKLSTEQIQV
ncbi:MAG: translation initiation factor IF-2, partial [Prevotellaceae bacterium]|nr:translation initiation factor IF-2 [Prevotellaceae bacterium]